MAIRTRAGSLQIDVQVTTPDGKRRYREKFTGSIPEAKARELQIKAALMGGNEPPRHAKAPNRPEGKRVTLGAALDYMMEKHWRGTPSERTIRSPIKHLLDRFGKDTPLEEITTEMIDAYVEEMDENGLKPSTIHKRVNPLSVAVNFYHRRGNLQNKPLFELPAIGKNGRIRIMTDEEREELFRLFREDYDRLVSRREGAPSGRDWHDFFVFLSDSGARAAEARRTRPGDYRDQRVDLLFTKNEDPRTIPLTGRAWEAVLRQIERRGRGVSPWGWNTESSVCHAWNWARSCMGLTGDPEFTSYLLRHDCATRLYGRTRNLLLVQKWLGHRDIKMTVRYAKLYPEELDAARDLLDGASATLQEVA